MAIFSPGANTPTGSLNPNELWLPKFSGEVQVFFEDSLLVTGLVSTKPAWPGIEQKFTRLGQQVSEEHQVGAEVLGTVPESAQFSMYLDKRPLITANTFDDVEAEMAQWETRGPLAAEQARELARQQERRAIKLVIRTARVTAIAGTSFPGGGIDSNGAPIINGNMNNADPTTAGAAILASIDRWVQYRDTINAPDGETYCVIPPQGWHALRNFNSVIYVAANISNTVASAANALNPLMPNLQTATSRKDYLVYKGVKIYMSNFIPTTNTTALEDPNLYGANYTNTYGVIWMREATAMVMMRGVKVETWRTPGRQSETVMSSTMTGGGPLRCELACELKLA
jgi:hypothetical protein